MCVCKRMMMTKGLFGKEGKYCHKKVYNGSIVFEERTFYGSLSLWQKKQIRSSCHENLLNDW